jgi:hypothetical protein
MNKTISNVPLVKFLGLLVDDTLRWDKHINQITSKLSSVCYAMRVLTTLLPINALNVLYSSCAHSIISYGIIFWGASTNGIIIFRLQKNILRIMTKSNKVESCRELFKEMEILPFYSQYMFSLLMYVVKNKQLFTKNWEIHSHNTRTTNNLHIPAVNTTKYKKGAYYMGSKIFNQLPNYIKNIANKVRLSKKFYIDFSSIMYSTL